jgi:hypothetical protein
MQKKALLERPLTEQGVLQRLARQREIIWPTVVVGLASLLVLALYPLLRGYTSPLDYAHIGRFFCCGAPGGPRASYGYDGQFYYYIATNPLHAPVQMDNPAYRYHRILYPMVVWALSLGGNPALVPWLLLIVNLVGLLAGTAALAVLLRRYGLSPWFSLVFGLYFGQFASLTHDVPDGLAVALVALAALALDRGRWKEALFWLAAAGLTRETVLVFAGGAALNLLFQKQMGRAALLLCAGVPFLVWLVVLRLLFGETGLFFSGVVSEAPRTPFAGLAGIAGASPRFAITLLVVVLPALLALGWAAREMLTKRWLAAPGWLFAVVVQVFLIVFLNTFTYSDLASTSRVIIGLPLAWLLYAACRRSRSLAWLASPWVLGGALYAGAVIINLQSIIP